MAKLNNMRVMSGAVGALATAAKLIKSLPAHNNSDLTALDSMSTGLKSQGQSMLIDEVSKLQSPQDIIGAASSIRYYADKLGMK